jgi:hypothetical protein
MTVVSESSEKPKVVVKYDVIHRTPGRDGTCLDQELTLSKSPHEKEWLAELHVTECKGENPEEALKKMVSWLRRLADGLESREPSTFIPL